MGNIIVTFGKAVVNHLADSMEKRPQEQVDYIYNEFCTKCEFFSEGRCTHTSCGCNVNTRNIFLNKLKWASEACPIGKWGPGEIVVPSGYGV